MENKCLLALTPTRQTNFGSAPFVYTLGGRGRKYVREEGLEEYIKDTYPYDEEEEPKKKRFRPSEERKRGGIPFTHSLAVEEVLLNAFLLDRDRTLDPRVTVINYETEQGFNERPLTVQVPQKGGGRRFKTVDLKPDLWLHVKRGSFQYFFCVEANLTEVEQKRWREKVRNSQKTLYFPAD